jgi:uncharacterized membrane protein
MMVVHGRGYANTERRVTSVVAHIMRLVGRHWLTLVNLAMFFYIGLAVLAPVLAHVGESRWAHAIHLVYSPLCHQLPERSFFLYGPQATYSRDELRGAVGDSLTRRYPGDAQIGYKLAVCERCTGIYTAWLFFGILFSLARSRLAPLPARAFLALLAPVAIDGVGQLVGLWSSSWQGRLITGALFSLAIVWLTYPYLEKGMAEMHDDAVSMLSGSKTQ